MEDHSWRADRRTDRQPREGGMEEEEERCWRTTVGGLTGGQSTMGAGMEDEERCWRTTVGGLTGEQTTVGGGDGGGGVLLEDHGWRTDRWTVNRGSRDGGGGRCWRTTVGGLTGGQTDNRGRGGWRRRRNAVGGPRLED